MQPTDNSDHSWLVVADWMDDNGILGAAELRESIAEPVPNRWEYQYRRGGGGVGVGG